MTLQRMVGAAVLSFVFIVLAVLLLHDSSDDDISTNVTADDLNMDAIPETEMTAVTAPSPLEGGDNSTDTKIVVEDVEPTITPSASAKIEKAEEKVPAVLTVPKPATVETPSISWFLQIASFSKQENAKQLIQNLKQKGIIAKADMVVGQKGQIYRVRTMPQASKDNVAELAEKIKQQFNITPQLLRRNNR